MPNKYMATVDSALGERFCSYLDIREYNPKVDILMDVGLRAWRFWIKKMQKQFPRAKYHLYRLTELK